MTGTGGFARMVIPFAAALVMFFVVVLLLASIVLPALWLAILAALAATGLLTLVLYAKFRRMRSGTRVRFSPAGVQLDDARGYTVQLAWPDITEIDTVTTQLAHPRAVGLHGGVQTQVAPMRSLGLIGWGQRTLPGNAPAWLRQHQRAQPINPEDGRPLVAIPLGGIDPNWRQGAMGAWVRHYRPDLLEETAPGNN